MNDYRRAVNTLTMPDEKNKAVERAAEELARRIERAEALRKLAKPDLNDLERKMLERFLDSEIAKYHRKTFPEDEIFKLQRKFFDELVLAGGEITVSKDEAEIDGLVRVDDKFTKQTIGQTTFG